MKLIKNFGQLKQAIQAGSVIQWRVFTYNMDMPEHAIWKDIPPNEKIDMSEYEYRIKPEPKYRPFKDAKEAIVCLGKGIFSHVYDGRRVEAICDDGVYTEFKLYITFGELIRDGYMYVETKEPVGIKRR